MKKFILVSFCLCSSMLILAHPVFAASDPADPFAIEGCDRTTEFCPVPADSTNSKLSVGKERQFNSTAPLVGITESVSNIWDGFVKPAGNQLHVGSALSLPFANQVQNASLEINPKELQDITIHNTLQNSLSLLGRLCVYSAADPGKVIGSFPSKRPTTADTPWINPLLEGLTRFDSMVMGLKHGPDFRQPSLMIKGPLPCGVPTTEAQPIAMAPVSSQGGSEYGSEGNPARTQEDITITDAMQGIGLDGNNNPFYYASVKTSADHTTSGLLPWIGHILCLSAGCKVADLDPIAYLTGLQKNVLQQVGGLFNMYRPNDYPADFGSRRDAVNQNQEWEVTIGSSINAMKNAVTDTFYFALARPLAAQTYGNCSLKPSDDPERIGLCNEQPLSKPQSTTACESNYFYTLQEGIAYSRKTGGSPNAGYTIPYRDSSFSLTDAMKKEAITLMGTGFMNGGQKGTDNINMYWDQINITAKKYGWNPIFVATLWIEESGAGGHPRASQDLGCVYGWSKANQGAVAMPKIGSSTNVCDQMACLFSHPVKNPDDFSGFLCSYNSDAASLAKYNCSAAQGWQFPKTVKVIYDRLINAK